MYKQSPSRNHRSKGIKAKHVLQICLLLAVCFWLIYQVKHSQEKRRELNSKDEKVVDKLQKDGEILRFGRKDLPRVSEIATGGDKHAEDDDEKDAEEEEETKHDEDEPEKEDEIVEEIDEEKGGGDDETNENEEELKEADHKHLEEQVDEDKDEEDVEEDTEDKHAEHSEAGENEDTKKEDLPKAEENQVVSSGDHDEGDAASSNGQGHGTDNGDNHEKREEPYKADDASSEVANNVQNIIPENENVTKVHANSIFGKVDFMPENETKSSNNPGALNTTQVESRDDSNKISNMTSLAMEHPSLSNGTQTMINANVLGDNSKASSNLNKTEDTHTNVEESLSSTSIAVDTRKADDTHTTGAEKNSSATDGGRDNKSDQSSSSAEGVIQHDPIDESDTHLTDEEK